MPEFTPEIAFAAEVHAFYWKLIRAANLPPAAQSAPDVTLGGSLLYAGPLDEKGRALVIAGNVSGCATLAVSPDPAVQKKSVRDGVIDFLVNSLDEALRILKNEIRQRKTVAVCVAATPEAIEAEMTERGVQPDLDRPTLAPDLGGSEQTLLAWTVSSAPAQWMPKLDVVALELLPPQDIWTRRWLRLSPRYLGRPAQGFRLLPATSQFGEAFLGRVHHQVELGQIAVPVTVQLIRPDRSEQHQFNPVIPA